MDDPRYPHGPSIHDPAERFGGRAIVDQRLHELLREGKGIPEAIAIIDEEMGQRSFAGEAAIGVNLQRKHLKQLHKIP